MMLNQRVKEFAPDTSQGRTLLKIASILVVLATGCHLIMGASSAAVLFCAASIILSLLPLAYFGPFNIAAVLVALVGFRYVGFPFFAKLAMGQVLNKYLQDPTGSFGVVLVGVIGYSIALIMSSRIPIGRPLLAPTSNPTALGRISFLAGVVGITANTAVAFRAGETYTGITVATFFTPFLHLSLIAAIARVLIRSNHKRSLNIWVLAILIAELASAMVSNSPWP